MAEMTSVSGAELKVAAKYIEAVKTNPSLEQKLCKVCGNEGLRVLPVTMATHLDAEYWDSLGDGFRFSFTPDCPVIYYNNKKGSYFVKQEVKTRFGLKEEDAPRPICYCLQVTEEQIAKEILEKGCCYSLQDIVSYTKAGTGKWCLTTNPSGKCCRDYLTGVVDKYLDKIGKKPVRKDLEAIKRGLETEGPLQELTLDIKGMTCESCTLSVKAMLEKIGGKDVEVSLQKSQANVKVPTAIPADEVAAAVEDLGYAVSIKEAKRLDRD